MNKKQIRDIKVIAMDFFCNGKKGIAYSSWQKITKSSEEQEYFNAVISDLNNRRAELEKKYGRKFGKTWQGFKVKVKVNKTSPL